MSLFFQAVSFSCQRYQALFFHSSFSPPQLFLHIIGLFSDELKLLVTLEILILLHKVICNDGQIIALNSVLLGHCKSSENSEMSVDSFCLYIRGISVNWSLYPVISPGVWYPRGCLPLPPVPDGILSNCSKINFGELLPSLFWYQAFVLVSSSLLRCSCSHLFLAYPGVKQHVSMEFQHCKSVETHRHGLPGPARATSGAGSVRGGRWNRKRAFFR